MAPRKQIRSKKTTKTSRRAKPAKTSRAARKVTLTKPTGKRSEGLTPRQKEILKLVSQGNTNRDIARRLTISVRTVEVHRFNLMRRLKVRNVAQLLRQALQDGFLPKNFAFK
ncbi:MAG TPA: LuxR C-terminal-related transcriptional regulator [Nitrospira sp.]|jgi:DNA-binding NarL/FixJ family response regulator|nr:LuxR C-terminal-related transcriptional regulator [Nitrospira sp.]